MESGSKRYPGSEVRLHTPFVVLTVTGLPTTKFEKESKIQYLYFGISTLFIASSREQSKQIHTSSIPCKELRKGIQSLERTYVLLHPLLDDILRLHWRQAD